jgi:hypothetical protein
MLTRQQQVQARSEGEATIEKMMGAFSLDAVTHATKMGVSLDYTEASLNDVELILSKLENSRPSEPDLQAASKCYGGYIGEVMRFEWGGGEWLVPSDGPFQGALTFQYRQFLMSPPDKVYKRLTNGSEDNILFYFEVFKEKTDNVKTSS